MPSWLHRFSQDKGIEFAKQAVEADEAAKYEKALQLYLTSLEYFKTYLKVCSVRCSQRTMEVAIIGFGFGTLIKIYLILHAQVREERKST